MKMKKRPFRKYSFVLLISLLLLMPGCYDVEEINQRGSANVIFFDVGTTDTTKMGATFHIPGTVLPPVGTTYQEFEKRYFTIAGEGNGALDAWREIQANTTRTTFFGQMSGIIFSERFVRSNDLNDSLDFMGRLRNVNSNALLVVTKDDPQQLVDIATNNNFLPGQYMALYFQSPFHQMLAIPITMWQAFRIIDAGTADVYMPIMDVSQGQYIITGTALFSQNSMVGELDMYETGTLAMLRGVQDGYLTVPLPEEGTLSLVDVAAKTRISPQYDGQGNLLFEIETKITANMGERTPRKKEVTASEKKRYENVTKQYTETQISNLLAKLQQLNSDPVGFGGNFRVAYPKRWEQVEWHQLYPTANFNVTTEVNIRGTGIFR